MFTSLHALAKRGTLMITMTAEGDDQLRVNMTAMPFDTKAKASLPQPLSLVATPAEFDAGFAEALATWQAPKRSLVQQVQDATDTQAPAAAGDAQKSAKQDKGAGKSSRKPRAEKTDEQQPANLEAAGAAAGDAATAADEAMAGATDEANLTGANDAAVDVQPGGDAPPSVADAAPAAPAAPAAAGPQAVDADGFEKVDTMTLDLF